jgi:hypothetical protein
MQLDNGFCLPVKSFDGSLSIQPGSGILLLV